MQILLQIRPWCRHDHARGYLCRYLDGANLPKEQIKEGLIRIVLELQREGYETESLRVAARKIQPTTVADLRTVWQCLYWTQAHKQSWIKTLDMKEAEERQRSMNDIACTLGRRKDGE